MPTQSVPVLTEWQARVLRAASRIPRGQVATYQAIAQGLGRPRAARAVGNALHRNPDLARYPCHRVVQSSGRVGGYVLGTRRKVQKLKAEGVRFVKNLTVAPECLFSLV
jgi:O-6-methylguanine DNA methyltransferase